MSITNPMSARVLVYNVVVDWVGNAVGIPPSKVVVSRTFKGAPPAGYGFNRGRFLQMCDEIVPTLVLSSGRSLSLPGKWRLDHEDDVIAEFIDAVAVRLMAAPMNASGIKAHEFAMAR